MFKTTCSSDDWRWFGQFFSRKNWYIVQVSVDSDCKQNWVWHITKKIGRGWNVFFPTTFNMTPSSFFIWIVERWKFQRKTFHLWNMELFIDVESWFFFFNNLASGFIHVKCLTNCKAPLKTSRLKIIAYFMGKWHRHIQIRKSNQNSILSYAPRNLSKLVHLSNVIRKRWDGNNGFREQSFSEHLSAFSLYWYLNYNKNFWIVIQQKSHQIHNKISGYVIMSISCLEIPWNLCIAIENYFSKGKHLSRLWRFILLAA